MSLRSGIWLLAMLCLVPSATFSQDDALQEQINKAIDKGVIHLKKLGASGVWADPNTAGMTALAAWTLLESGVPGSDPVVQKAAAYLRKESITLTTTYYQALAILFFDRLGEPRDEAVIQTLAVRLMAGQKSNGTWTYKSEWGNQADRDWLERKIQEAGTNKNSSENKLPDQIQQQIDKLQKAREDDFLGDNSNTQFAMLALWVARRHALPVDQNLSKVEKHFRNSQIASESWSYTGGGNAPPRATMTCAGLLGLALGEGVRAKKDGKTGALQKDPAVQGAMRLLGTLLKNPEGQVQKNMFERPGRLYYFLFSLERMAVVYDVKTVGEHNWYTWGAKILLDKQKADGSWMGEYPIADTCFALLFLKRANVAEDLTLNLNPLAKPPQKKKLKKSEREADPFDTPPDKEKKKIKIRPKDKQSGLWAPESHLCAGEWDPFVAFLSGAVNKERKPAATDRPRAISLSAPSVRRWSS